MKLLLTLLLISSLAGAATYKEKPSEVWVEDVHYDEALGDIVIHVHAHFLFIHINRMYGIKVKRSPGIKEKVDEVVGGSPAIMELN